MTVGRSDQDCPVRDTDGDTFSGAPVRPDRPLNFVPQGVVAQMTTDDDTSSLDLDALTRVNAGR